MADPPPRPKEATLSELLPADWAPSQGGGLAVAYTMLGVSQKNLSPPVSVVLGDVCMVMGNLGLPMLAVQATIGHSDEGQIEISMRTADEGELRTPSATSLFITPLSDDEDAIDKARTRVHQAVGLLSVVESKLIAYEHVEDYRISFETGMFSSVPVLLAETAWWSTPDISEAARERWAQAAAILESSDQRTQVELSLRWYDEAKREGGIDAFLKLWFAIEILAMPDTTSISPVRDKLQQIYPNRDIEAEFGIGRIFGLRGRIVHQGVRVDLSPRLLGYLGALYADLFAVTLGVAPPESARERLVRAGGLRAVLPSVVGGRSEEADREQAAAWIEKARRERGEDPEPE